jgi:hypothetical protein
MCGALLRDSWKGNMHKSAHRYGFVGCTMHTTRCIRGKRRLPQPSQFCIHSERNSFVAFFNGVHSAPYTFNT